MLTIKIAKLGSTVHEVALDDRNNTVEHALKAARIDAGSDEIRVGGVSARPTTELSDGDTITLVPSVKGGGNW